MRPGWIGSLSRTWAAGSGPWRRRISGRALVPVAGRWRTTNTAAERSLGSEAARSTSASTPPAEAPTTTMTWSGMTGLLNTGAGRVAAAGPGDPRSILSTGLAWCCDHDARPGGSPSMMRLARRSGPMASGQGGAGAAADAVADGEAPGGQCGQGGQLAQEPDRQGDAA